MKDHAIAYVGAAIISLLLFSTIFALVSNSKHKHRLKAEKLQSESLLSEKLLVQKELDNLKSQQAALNIKNDANEKLVSDDELKLADSEKRIASLLRDNNSLNKNRKELADLQKEKADLDKTYADLKLEHEKALAQNRELQGSVATIEAQKNEIAGKLEQAELYDSDNFEVYGSRGKTKEMLTLRARRTKKLNVYFDVPQTLKESVSFKIISPSGTTITPDDKALSWTYPPDYRKLTASLSNNTTREFEQSRQVALTYDPKEKLTRGEYKVLIFCNNKNIGSCRFKLR